MENQQADQQTENDELVLTRVLNAPRELVFQIWSEVEHLKNWWGPVGFEWGYAKLDFQPGGSFHYQMRAPEGFEMWGKFVYHEIEAPERIVFVNSFSDEEGSTVRAPFSPTFPLEIRNVVTFTEQDGKTTITLRGGPINATEEERAAFRGMKDSMNQGFNGTFNQLEAYLASVRE
ncbi:SRPBCC domain-containing protein [Paenibacillus sp. N3.4]|uniref:SRPBCC family protein n=1 Tax=Paenibacillus sp. N3.4 TaxID=2603222 RepID=UPI0011CAD74F|nr:SRPBCC domain-containing protein [Paenibacillus sp. N3.4]TXK83831.1 SRPBCC domain-containing protein [Paenibacillus sp. N3.4]